MGRTRRKPGLTGLPANDTPQQPNRCHMGQVIRAYRCHPYHGRQPLPQEVVASWVGIAQAQLSRIEHGPAIVHLDRLIHWARTLRIPACYLWFKLPDTAEAQPTMPPTYRHPIAVDGLAALHRVRCELDE